jgi:hypothetical protein
VIEKEATERLISSVFVSVQRGPGFDILMHGPVKGLNVRIGDRLGEGTV